MLRAPDEKQCSSTWCLLRTGRTGQNLCESRHRPQEKNALSFRTHWLRHLSQGPEPIDDEHQVPLYSRVQQPNESSDVMVNEKMEEACWDFEVAIMYKWSIFLA